LWSGVTYLQLLFAALDGSINYPFALSNRFVVEKFFSYQKHSKLATLIWRSFRSLPSLLNARPNLRIEIPGLLSEYRNTSVTLQDGLSEWKGEGGLWIAEDDDHLVGLLRMDKHRTFWYLSSFVVRPEFQGKGYGKQLLRTATEHADKPVILRVKHENPAQEMYTRHRFQEESIWDGRRYMKYYG
jgi:ribosomal protein S18 acetylase RimI-like enzyme